MVLSPIGLEISEASLYNETEKKIYNTKVQSFCNILQCGNLSFTAP